MQYKKKVIDMHIAKYHSDINTIYDLVKNNLHIINRFLS